MAEPMNNVPSWQFNTIPGNANQGAILMTRNDIGLPPFNQDDFIWKAMEDVIGTADVKLEYDEENNVYILSKALGHLDNDGNWTYEWTEVGTWEPITEEVGDILKSLTYIEYRYDTTTPNTLKVYGIKKDTTEVLLVNINFASKQYVDDAVAGIKGLSAGNGISVVYDSTSDKNVVSIKADANDFTFSNGDLKSNLIADSLTTSTIKTWSIDKIKDWTKYKWEYKGTVQDKTLLPDNPNRGDVYGVIDESDLYVYLDSITTWYPFTYVYEALNSYAIELKKGPNGLYGKLRYDTTDFTIDASNNLKSQLIDDTLGELDTNANKHTYSIPKIISLLTSVMRYKGQVDYYDELPASGNVVGDCWNVKYDARVVPPETPVETGYNYAWNGTSWDRLAGQYIAGAGIVINGNVISATGISFQVGQGLAASGAGSTTTLYTKLGNGVEFDTNDAIRVKQGAGITVDGNGVSTNTGYTTKTENNMLEVKPYQGLVNTNDGVSIYTNFIIKTTPLGSDNSKLALYTDGKIAVDFTESPVVITSENIFRQSITLGQHSLNNISIPRANEFDFFEVGVEGIASVFTTIKTTYTDYATTIRPNGMGTDSTPPTGMNAWMVIIEAANLTAGTITNIRVCYAPNMGSWQFFNATSGSPLVVYVNGLKAR